MKVFGIVLLVLNEKVIKMCLLLLIHLLILYAEIICHREVENQ